MNDETGTIESRRHCMDMARRDIVRLLWASANVEVAVTFPQTESIFNGVSPDGMAATKVRVVNNLKHAWQFLLDQADWPVGWPTLSEYNLLVGDGLEPSPGLLRPVPVRISGTSWVPPVPERTQVEDDIARCLSLPDPTDRAIALFGAVSRGQWFSNGNKRTATMAANHVLIHEGAGVFALPPELMRAEFRPLLCEYYETNDVGRLSDWLKRHAVRPVDEGEPRAGVGGPDPRLDMRQAGLNGNAEFGIGL